MEGNRLSKIEDLLKQGCLEKVFPGAVLLVAQGGRVRLFHQVGTLSLSPNPLPVEKDSLFDLASMTKPLATTMAMMKLVDAGNMALDLPIEELIQESVPGDKKGITPHLLLCHSAGFADWMPFYLELDRVAPEDRKIWVRKQLLARPLAYSPGTQTLYSDLGFMLLEWMVEEIAECDLPTFLTQEFYDPLSLKHIGFFNNDRSGRFNPSQFAATEACPWRKRIIQGAVHDENAYALGGYSGHAGLFGTAKAVYSLVDLLRGHWRGQRDDYLRPETVRSFFTRQGIAAGSTWALGWDTPTPDNSSSGKHFSAKSVGHLGFTGTSMWMDLKQDVIIILLTNRIHPTRHNEKIRGFRPLLHDRVMEALV